MLLVQLRKSLCRSTYVEITRPVFRDPHRPPEVIYEGEALRMPSLYDDRRVDKIATSVNRFGSPEILIRLEY